MQAYDSQFCFVLYLKRVCRSYLKSVELPYFNSTYLLSMTLKQNTSLFEQAVYTKISVFLETLNEHFEWTFFTAVESWEVVTTARS